MSLPKPRRTKRERQLFNYLLFWNMYQVHTNIHLGITDAGRKTYEEKKELAMKDTPKSIVEKIERAVIKSTLFNQFLKERGVPPRICK